MTAPGETPATSAWKDRWRFELHCRDCLAAFDVERQGLHVTLEQSAPNQRLVLMAVPEVCPACRNLKLVRVSSPPGLVGVECDHQFDESLHCLRCGWEPPPRSA